MEPKGGVFKKPKFQGKCYKRDKVGHKSTNCRLPIDTRATRHVCFDRGIFTTFEPVQDGESLFMGNLATLAIKGRENVILKMSSRKNVLYVPKIRKNLVSESLLNKHSFRMVFECDALVLTKSGLFVGKGYECWDVQIKCNDCKTQNE